MPEDIDSPSYICKPGAWPQNEILTIDEVTTAEDNSISAMPPRALALLPLTSIAALTSGLLLRWSQLQVLSMAHLRPKEHGIRMVLMFLDIFTFALLSLKVVLNTYAAMRGKARPRLRVHGTSVPSVDVVITCCNEDIDIIIDTVRAALNLDYPSDRFRVIVADDGDSRQLKDLVLLWRAENKASNVHYIRRTKTLSDRNKAGNLNNAAKFLATLPEGPFEYIATLDADMIPERHWLRASVPHLLIDDELGFTCPAQMFYNTPQNDPLFQTLYKFFRYEEMLRDRVGCALCTGSGWVMRRTALDSIGGFPTSTLTEDTYTANLTMGRGWKTAYLPEALQYGLVPETYQAHVKQYRRWNLGNVQCGLRMNYCIFGNGSKFMSFRQRAFGFLYTLLEVQGGISGLTSIASTLLLFSGQPMVLYFNMSQLRLLLKLTSISHLFGFFLDCNTAMICGFAATFREQSFNTYMAPYYLAEQIRHYIVPRWMGGKVAKFIASGSIPDRLQERCSRNRAPLMRRLKVILFHDGVVYHVLYIALNTLAIGLIVRRATTLDFDEDTTRTTYLLTRIGWPPLQWLLSSVACLTPIWYGIAPPDVPDREKLLRRDPQTHLAYPVKGPRHFALRYSGFLCESLPPILAFYSLMWAISLDLDGK